MENNFISYCNKMFAKNFWLPTFLQLIPIKLRAKQISE
jgi:hypothetical protein